jgi:TonB family protein
MIKSSISVTQRSIANKSLARTLLFGLGGSLLCHTVAIAGITYFAQNAEDSIEIIAIDRVEVDPELIASPLSKPITPIAEPVASAVKPISVPKPKAVKPMVLASPSPKPVVVIPQPKAVSPAPVIKITKAKVPVKLPTAPLDRVISPQPDLAAKPPIPVKDILPKIDRSQPPPFTPNLFKETNNQPALGNTPPTSTRSTAKINQKVEKNSNNNRSTPKQPDRQSKLARSSPRLPINNNQPSPANPNNNSQNKSPQDLGKLPDNPTGDNLPIGDSGSGGSGNSSQTAPSNPGSSADSNNQTGTGKGNGQGESGGNVRATDNRQYGSPEGTIGSTGNSDKSSNSSSNKELGTSPPGNVAAGGNRKLSIQCLNNCEIKYPNQIEDADTGKDKILVRVTIDAAGSPTNVEIARSSGNPKLDSFTLTGVQQMQFTSMGKPLTFKIKVSTLVGN